MGRRAEEAKAAHRAVERALASRRVVRVDRSIRGVDPIEGFVVAQGIRWVLVERLTDDLTLDGYVAVRWKHISRVRPLGDAHVGARSLRNAGIGPRHPGLVDATTTGVLLRSIPGTFGVVSVRTEADEPGFRCTGPIVGFGTKCVAITPIEESGRFADRFITVPFGRITRIDLGTRYQTALAHAAGLDLSGDDQP